MEIRDADGAVLLRLGVDARAVDDDQLIDSAVSAIRAGVTNHRLHAELLTTLAELRASRERIVEAGLTERRRLERDLHDGAQQQLLGVAATLAQTDLVDEGTARALVTDARASLLAGLAELRSLARGIHPPLLDGRGLSSALTSLAERSAVRIDCDLDPAADELSPALSAAAYFIAAELLANIARHSGADRVTLTTRLAGDSVHLTVTDNGQGGASFKPGGGLAGLRDRAEALGGRLDVDPGEGTSVTATLPCAPRNRT